MGIYVNETLIHKQHVSTSETLPNQHSRTLKKREQKNCKVQRSEGSRVKQSLVDMPGSHCTPGLTAAVAACTGSSEDQRASQSAVYHGQREVISSLTDEL